MLFRKYLAFVPSTSPWVWCCLLTWWADRLFVEFGHRATDASLCTHNALQYVTVHQYLTIAAVTAQIIYSVRERLIQFRREAAIMMGTGNVPCTLHIYIIQTIVCIAWTTIVVCLIDVSPWLCMETVVNNRASISFAAVILICIALPVEAWIWDKTLQDALKYYSGPIDI